MPRTGRDMTAFTRRDLLALLLVLTVAALLRFQQSDVVEYFHDDAMLSTLALELVSGGRFPFTGILSSTGIPNAPASVYLLAIPFSLNADPQFAIHFIMLLNTSGVGLLWLLARWQFGARIALLAAMTYALNPWAILFSRKIWAQELHTPLILLGILLAVYGFWKERDRQRNRTARVIAQCLSLPILSFGVQIHFAALALLPAMALMILRGRRQIIRPAFALSAVLALLVVLPYAAGLSQTLEADPDRISDAARRASDDGLGLSAKPLQDVVFLASGYGMETWLAPDQQDSLAELMPALRPLSLMLLIPLFLGAIACYKRKKWWGVVLLLWAFLPALLLVINWTPSYIHYFIPTIPALAMLTGLGIDFTLTRSEGRRFAAAAIALFVFVAWMLQTISWQVALSYVAEQHVAYPGFTAPLRSLNPLRDRLRHEQDVVVISAGMSWNLHHEAAVWDTLLWRDVACVRALRDDGYAVFPDHAFAVVIAPDARADPVRNLYRSATPELFPMREGGAVYVVHRWESAPPWNGIAASSIPAARFDNGVQLTGYGLADDQVLLSWRLPERQVGRDYQFSAQLFDKDGGRLSQFDATFWHGRHWCAGDRLYTWGTLPAPAEADLLKVAMYRLGEGKKRGQFFNAEVLDEMGNAKGQSVDIRL